MLFGVSFFFYFTAYVFSLSVTTLHITQRIASLDINRLPQKTMNTLHTYDNVTMKSVKNLSF